MMYYEPCFAYPSAVLRCLIKQYLSDCCAKACLISRR